MPEAVWKAYIDFEIEQAATGSENYDPVRNLYERLLDITQHVKVWISYAKFEEEQVGSIDNARLIYERGCNHFKDFQPDQKEERVMLLETWLQFEMVERPDQTGGLDSKEAERVRAKLPKRVKKRRKVQAGEEVGWEEFFDYIFPEDKAQGKNLKILEMAHKWKTVD